MQYAPTPILPINPRKYPNHAKLVQTGQRLPGHPGQPSDEGFPLTRLPVWVMTAQNPSLHRNEYYTKNRAEATKLCKRLGVEMPREILRRGRQRVPPHHLTHTGDVNHADALGG